MSKDKATSPEIPLNPFNLSAMDGGFDPAILAGTIDSLSASLAENMRQARANVTGRIVNTKLNALRSQVPFAVITPIPDKVVTGVLTANVAQDFAIPSGCQMIRFKGNGDYYVSINGNAAVPLATDTANANFNAAMYKPEENYFFVNETQTLSIVAPNSNTIVTMQCFIQL